MSEKPMTWNRAYTKAIYKEIEIEETGVKLILALRRYTEPSCYPVGVEPPPIKAGTIISIYNLVDVLDFEEGTKKGENP